MASNRPATIYVADTHALFWFLERPERLSAAAAAAFRLATLGEARIIVPAIVVAEFYYVTLRLGDPILPAELIADIKRSREFEFSALGERQLAAIATVVGVTEMHDRLIAAEALVWQAPIITKDQVLRESGVAPVIW